VAHFTVLKVNTRRDRKVLEQYVLNDNVIYILFYAVSLRSVTWRSNVDSPAIMPLWASDNVLCSELFKCCPQCSYNSADVMKYPFLQRQLELRNKSFTEGTGQQSYSYWPEIPAHKNERNWSTIVVKLSIWNMPPLGLCSPQTFPQTSWSTNLLEFDQYVITCTFLSFQWLYQTQKYWAQVLVALP
jgi:hypothetical protein